MADLDAAAKRNALHDISNKGAMSGMSEKVRQLAAAPPVLACLAMVGVVGGLRLALPAEIGPVATLALLGTAGAATYAGMLYLVWPDIVRQSIAMIRRTPADPLPTAAATPAPAGRTRDAAE